MKSKMKKYMIGEKGRKKAFLTAVYFKDVKRNKNYFINYKTLEIIDEDLNVYRLNKELINEINDNNIEKIIDKLEKL